MSGRPRRPGSGERLQEAASLCTGVEHSPMGKPVRGGIWLQVAHARREAMPHQGGTWPSQVPSCGPGHLSGLTPTHVQGRPLGLQGHLPNNDGSGRPWRA